MKEGILAYNRVNDTQDFTVGKEWKYLWMENGFSAEWK